MSRDAAQQALAAGDLAGCRARLVEAVRASPGDPALRAFLFQFFCVIGEWDRAAQQLEILGQLSAEALDMVADYRAAIAAETTRAEVFAGRVRPSVFGEPQPWIGDLIEALKHEADGAAETAFELRARALEAAPAETGKINGTDFPWLADADTRFGPVLEVVMNGAYRWLPMTEVAVLEVQPPRDLRDAVWTVALLTINEGGQWPLLIHTRYPGSEASTDATIALARRTEWRPLAGEHAAGLGQRLLAYGDEDIALFDIRTIAFDRAEHVVAAAD